MMIKEKSCSSLTFSLYHHAKMSRRSIWSNFGRSRRHATNFYHVVQNPLTSLVDCLTGWLMDCLAGWLAGGLTTDWLTDRLIYWLTNWLTGWLAGWLTSWLTNWLTGWQTNRLTDWLTDWHTKRLTVWPSQETDWASVYKSKPQPEWGTIANECRDLLVFDFRKHSNEIGK